MARKLDTSRLYKVLRFIVLAISVVSLALGIFVTIRYEASTDIYQEILSDCIDFKERTGIDYTDCSNDFNRNMEYMANFQSTAFLIGIGLPVLFFGGGALLNYIAPKEDKTNGKKDSN